jgi:hypothetical protein
MFVVNERLKTLYDESVEYTKSRHVGKITQIELNHICANKFAELIIRECCDIADQVEKADMDSFVSKYIKAYFEIKE